MVSHSQSWAFDFFVGISSGRCRGGDGGKASPFLGKMVDIEVFKAGDVMGQLWPDILAYGGHGGSGVGVTLEVRLHRFAVGYVIVHSQIIIMCHFTNWDHFSKRNLGSITARITYMYGVSKIHVFVFLDR